MTATTIKVERAIRDRLAVLAHERGMTMGALLTEATARMERESFFATARRQLTQLRGDDPAAWEAYRAESRSWQESTDRDALVSSDEPGWWR